MAGPGPPVTVEAAGPALRPLIEGLLQFYVYDFSEFEPPDSPLCSFTEAGDFGAFPGLDAYWSEPGSGAYLIRVGLRPAGFALVDRRSHREDGSVEHNVGEFFVARRYRRSGVATRALAQLFAARPGRWEAAVAERNRGALAFWPRALAAAGATGIVRHEGDGRLWRGPIYSFSAPG